MASLRQLKKHFSSAVRSRGRQYVDDDLVQDLDVNGHAITSHVIGSDRYNVHCTFNGDGEVAFTCECADYRFNEEPCKHIWATLLVADERGLLAGMPDEETSVAGPLQVTGPFALRPNFASGGLTRGSSLEPSWKRALSNLRDEPDETFVNAAPTDEGFPTDTRIAYVINADVTAADGRVCLELATQKKRKENSWHPPKRVQMAPGQWLGTPDATDRQIVQMLFGTGASDPAAVEARFFLEGMTIATILRQICETGRAVLKQSTDEREYTPLSWDDGPPYELWLDTTASSRPREWQIRATLRRGTDERLELDEPAVLLRSGYLIYGGRVSAMETFGAFDLAAMLRDKPQFSVPRENLREFVEELYTLPGVPKLQMPDEAKLEEIHAPFQPALAIAAPDPTESGEELSAQLSFKYGPKTVSPEDPRTGIVETENRVIVRDRAAERAAQRRLLSLGVRSERLRAKPREFRVPTAKLNDVVLGLVLEGWDVQASGSVFRQPGQVSMSVSSGIDWFDLHGSVDFGGQTASLPRLLAAIRKKQRTIVLDDGSIGVLPTEWLKQYAPLAGIGTVQDEALRFTKSQIGFLDALLAAAPAARFDEVFAAARRELTMFEGIKGNDPPESFVGTLRPYQRDGLGWLQFLRKFGFGGCLADDMGLGKAQPLDAKVLTPTGWTRMGDIVVGDEVVNPSGGTSTVLGVYPQGTRDVYRVTFSDGSATECCDEHLWQVTTPVRKRRGSPPRVLPLSEIRQRLVDSSGNRIHFVPMVKPVEFEPAGELPLPPYLLGVLLGDGGIAHRVILSSADAELLAHVESLLPVGVSMKHTGCGVDYRIRSPYRGIRNAVADELRALGLMGCRSEAKFIPDAYKVAPVDDRVELLRGLLDTDGHVRPTDNNVEFCTVSPRLAEDVSALVQSLGGTARVRTKRTTGQLAYRMSIALPAEVQPFRLRRKAAVYRARAKYPPTRAITSVEFVGPKPVQCIRVDAPDRLYVTDDFIVTHNTIQVLAMLEERRRNGSGTALVVVPRSLVFNWMQEASKFTPNMRLLDQSGPQRTRDVAQLAQHDVVVTTYGTLRRDAAFFKDFEFDYVVLDEAQAIKNAATASAKAARLLRAKHRLAMSGTPIENNLSELWSLFEFLNPGMLGSNAVFDDLADASSTSNDRAALGKALRPFILRRTKGQVAPDLPERIEQTIFCELEGEQRKMYDELREHYRTSLMDTVSKVGMGRATIQVLEALLRLRQAACHPGLIDPEKMEDPSAKMEAALAQIKEVMAEDHKVLLFSQFTSFLSIVRSRLDREQITYEYLDGQTRDRQSRVERFQNDPDCKLFLISLKAGGLGLNLTAADYVFLLDPWWNPAVEAQAIDRTHRIGQTRSVFAYRVIAKDTVEEKVLELQAKKRDLAEAIIGEDNSLISGLQKEDLEALLG